MTKTLRALAGTDYTVEVDLNGFGTAYDVYVFKNNRVMESTSLLMGSTEQDLENAVKEIIDWYENSIAGIYKREDYV